MGLFVLSFAYETIQRGCDGVHNASDFVVDIFIEGREKKCEMQMLQLPANRG